MFHKMLEFLGLAYMQLFKEAKRQEEEEENVARCREQSEEGEENVQGFLFKEGEE